MLLKSSLGSDCMSLIKERGKRNIKRKGVDQKSSDPSTDLSIGSGGEADPAYKEGYGEDAQEHFQYTGNHRKHRLSHTLNSASYNEECIHKDHHKAASRQKLAYKTDLLRAGKEYGCKLCGDKDHK